MAAPSSWAAQQSWLDPAGPAAARILDVWWVLTLTAAAITVVVLAVLAAAALRRRAPEAPGDTAAADRRGTRLILIAGGVAPALVLTGVYVFSLMTMAALHPDAAPEQLVVEVTGRQWWWHVRYQDSLAANVFATANEIRIPTGRRVHLRLGSDDVIHSFWVPALQGKTDLIPGRRTVTWIQADTPGVYRGQCAEFCGRQHARMGFVVVAMAPSDFEGWLANERQPARTPRTDAERRGREVFLTSGCVLCHVIRGTPTAGGSAPDLTHVGGRRTLAAGLLPNTRGHLASWIADPQGLKPGALMPRVPLSAGDLPALVEYLASLR